MDGYPVLQIVRCRLGTEMEMDSQGYPFPMTHSHSHLPHPTNHAHFPRPHYPHPCDFISRLEETIANSFLRSKISFQFLSIQVPSNFILYIFLNVKAQT
ncbi:hypothetical protein ACFW04_010164 [Cataglyphis niger]